jgi:hypothetical protein
MYGYILVCSEMKLVMHCQTTSVSIAHARSIVLSTVPRVDRSYELFPDGFDLYLLPYLLDLHRNT